MAYVKPTVDGDLVGELHSGKCITASELVELQANWRFFNQFVQLVKNVLADLPKMPGWDDIQAHLPHTTQGGACDWRDIVIILLVAPFLTKNTISALYKLLQASPGLCVVLGISRVPSPGRISQYKNHLLGEPVFLRLRLKLAQRLKRVGGLTLKKLVIDGAPLVARTNPRKLSMKEKPPYEAIQWLFEWLNLTWVDSYYPKRVWNQTPTSTVLSYYLLMYWLGMRCLTAIRGWLVKHPEVLPLVKLYDGLISLDALQGFRGRFERFVRENYGADAPFQTVEDLIRTVCADLRRQGPLAEIFCLDELQPNEYLFNLFRFRRRVSDPDAMTGYCHVRRTHILGYRVLIIVDAGTKMPLFGRVIPGNREEGSLARTVLDHFMQVLKTLETLTLPREVVLFADSAYDEAPVATWAQRYEVRLIIVRDSLHSRHTAQWSKRHRIRVEQALSDLTEVLKLSTLRTTTLAYVQIFVELVLTTRLAQGLVAFENGHPEAVPCPTYPIFGR